MKEPNPFRLALISSGLGHVTRGIEVWMEELDTHLPTDLGAELWSGGPVSPTARRGRRVASLSRDAGAIAARPWSKRYGWEQLSMLPAAVLTLRRRRMTLAYCGDPALTWHLKRFQSLHGAAVVFMNGMRLSPQWARHLDGVHLLAQPYLEAVQRELPAPEAGRFFAVPHFADLERFRPASPEQRAKARKELNLPAEALVVVTLGPVGSVSGKRLDHLAREVAGCAEAILVHGGGDEDGADAVRAVVQTALGPRAHLLGRVPRDRVATLFQAADVYSLGSLAEPFSIAILEALASGLPVVHHHDEVMNWQCGGGGVAISMELPGAATAAFRELATDRDRRNALSRSARALAEARYAPGPVCADLVAALRQVSRRS